MSDETQALQQLNALLEGLQIENRESFLTQPPEIFREVGLFIATRSGDTAASRNANNRIVEKIIGQSVAEAEPEGLDLEAGKKNDDGLLPCPFCGAVDEVSFGISHSKLFDKVRTHHHVECVGCGVMGPSRESDEEAAEDWNTRRGPGPLHPSQAAMELADKACGELADAVARDLDHHGCDHSKWFATVELFRTRRLRAGAEGGKP